jgi:polar amino acid transport system permease protein
MSSTAAGILALSLYGAVYFSESIRGAILSVPKGQTDAARATGMSHQLVMRKIVFPQMMGYVLPPISNQLIGLIKDSAVLSIIAVPELTMAFQNVLGTTFAAPETFVAVAALYWLLTSVVTLVAFRDDGSMTMASQGGSTGQTTSKSIIRVQNLHKWFGGLHILKGINLRVNAGEKICVMGPSGSGKSTLLRCLNFLEEP